MAELFDHIEYLSCEIGARPAGTEEEQEAALYIAEQFQKESGFHAEIEEFASASNIEGGRALLAAVVFVVSILAMIFNVLSIPAFVLALVATAIYALEAFDKPFVSRALARGASQNIVAKYLPGGEADGVSRNPRNRKLVVIAHYDTGKVKPALVSRVESMGLPIGYICVGAMALATLLLLVRVIMGGSGGPAVAFLNILTILCLLVTLLPIVKGVLYRIAPYNEGANNNASGVAAMLEVAKRISSGSMSEADLADGDAVIHGEEAARLSGLIPEGADLVYEAEPVAMEEFDEQDEEGRLLAAKAAIAALTGRPVESRVYAVPHAEEGGRGYEGESLDEPYYSYYGEDQASTDLEPIPEAATLPTPSQTIPQPVEQEATGFKNAPSWFVAAQKNARKTDAPAAQVQRSRYTDAIEEAERQAAIREQKRLQEEAARQAFEAQRAAQEQAQAQAKALEEAQAQAQAEPAPAIEAEVVEAAIEQQVAVAAVVDAQIDEAQAAMESAIEEATTAESALEGNEVAAETEPSGVQEAQLDETQAISEEPEVEPEADADETESDDSAADEPVDLNKTTAFTPVMVSLEDLPSDEELDSYYENDEGNELHDAINRLSNLPAVNQPEQSTTPPENTNPSRSGLFRKLRTDIPSLSGSIPMHEAGAKQPEKLDSKRIPSVTAPEPAQVAAPATPEAAPSSADSVEAVDYDMEVSLVDESAHELAATPAETARAGQGDIAETGNSGNEPVQDDHPDDGNVDMPSSRAGGFFSRFRKKKDRDLEETPQEWLDVDEDFDARSVGKKRGSWESFKQEDDDKNGDWNGGAFSRIRLGHVNTRSGEEEEEQIPEEAVEVEEDRELNDEIEQIIHFRNPLFASDIWFVAIGSDTELHDGAKAFVGEHADELRGAMIVEIESLGAGALSVSTEEGMFRKIRSSSRLKRFAQPATEATGIALDRVSLAGTDSISSVLQKAGFQVMHLFGAEDGMPALKGSADDVIENVDDLLLEENVNFLMELLRHGQ